MKSIKVENASFVDEQLQLKESDILLSATIDGRLGFIYFLMEHQSSVDPSITFRLWKYTIRILEYYLKQHDHSLKF